MNTATTKKSLGIVNVHSTIDLITNSSTEMFCVVEGSGAEAIQDVVNGILEEMGCRCMEEYGLDVEPYEKWDEEQEKEVYPEGQYLITYEQHAPPCKMITRRLNELLTIVENFDEQTR